MHNESKSIMIMIHLPCSLEKIDIDFLCLLRKFNFAKGSPTYILVCHTIKPLEIEIMWHHQFWTIMIFFMY